ncbi:flagellar protein FliT [Dyella sp. EPa41]|uniref:flagellar protein FliT n=1 Tax=Dyella sp. EPa41 TaxID=1561194 RepID=UPI001915EE92|nr:flagellar protein FliT [Dyella sp. EPa41]
MIDQLLGISARMVDAARAGDWDAVVQLEAERSPLIAGLSLGDPSALATFKALLVHTEEVRALAKQQRERLGEALGEHQQRHRALSAYLQTAND